MANTYTQIHIHGIFAVQNRISLITESWREELYNYITGIVQNHGHKLLQIGGMPDHIHILFGMRPVESLSYLMKAVKGESSEWINKQLNSNHIPSLTGRSWRMEYYFYQHFVPNGTNGILFEK